MSKPAKAAKVKVAKKGTSAKEIKAWLRGIQEFQPAGWTPSKEQWDAIREKIFSLDETAPAAAEAPYRSENVSRTYHRAEDDDYTPPKPFAAAQTFVASQPLLSSDTLSPAPAERSGTAIMKTLPGDGGVSVISDPNADGYSSPF